MKTSIKKRIVSAALALAMVASFLPANIFPAAKEECFSLITRNMLRNAENLEDMALKIFVQRMGVSG